MPAGTGFVLLFERIGDLLLDCPQAEQQVARFLARAVIDEAVPPAFISDRLAGPTTVGADVIQQAVVWLRQALAQHFCVPLCGCLCVCVCVASVL